MPAGIPALIADITVFTPTAYNIVSSPRSKRITFILRAPLHSFILRANEWSSLCITLHAHFPARTAIKHLCRQCSEAPSVRQWMRMPIISGWFSHRQLLLNWTLIIVSCVCNTISVENAIVRGMSTNTRFRLCEKSGSVTHQSRCLPMEYGRMRMMWTFCVRCFSAMHIFSCSTESIECLEAATKCSKNHKLALSVFIQSILRSMATMNKYFFEQKRRNRDDDERPKAKLDEFKWVVPPQVLSIDKTTKLSSLAMHLPVFTVSKFNAKSWFTTRSRHDSSC